MERLTNSRTKEAKPSVTIKEIVDKLAEYEDLKEQGLLKIFPCKVGDTVYRIYSPNRLVYPYTYTPVTLKSVSEIAEYVEKAYFGKTVFLTPEAAEEALERMNRED